MSASSDPTLAILMLLRVKGRATAHVVTRATRLAADIVESALEAARQRGAVRPVGDDDTVALTPSGHAEIARLLADERLDRPSLDTLYARFVAIDRTLKERISSWQVAPAGTAALHAVASDATPFASALGAVAARFAPYEARLRAALVEIEHGDARFVASPFVDSLHQVWFELHEDLLVTLGRTRTA